MFEFLKAFKKRENQKKSDEKSGEDSQSSSQDEVIASRDIFVDPVIKKLKNAKVNEIAQCNCNNFTSVFSVFFW